MVWGMPKVFFWRFGSKMNHGFKKITIGDYDIGGFGQKAMVNGYGVGNRSWSMVRAPL